MERTDALIDEFEDRWTQSRRAEYLHQLAANLVAILRSQQLQIVRLEQRLKSKKRLPAKAERR